MACWSEPTFPTRRAPAQIPPFHGLPAEEPRGPQALPELRLGPRQPLGEGRAGCPPSAYAGNCGPRSALLGPGAKMVSGAVWPFMGWAARRSRCELAAGTCCCRQIRSATSALAVTWLSVHQKTAFRGRGKVQHLCVKETLIVKFLEAALASLSPEVPLYPGSPGAFRRRWDELLGCLGILRSAKLLPRSLHGGGAGSTWRAKR